MRPFTMNPLPPTMFGEGASLKTGEILKELGVKKAMICCDKGVRGVGLIDPIAKCIEDAGIGCVIFDGVVPNPTEASVYAGADFYAENGCDAIVGVGGGSAMDTSKALSILSSNPRPLKQYYLGPDMVPAQMRSNKLVLIATTSGTGSEMGIGGIITSDETGFKMVIMGPHLKADQAILDPTLTAGVPKFTTAITGLDAMSHALDGLFTTNRSVITDIYMGKAIELIWNNLGKVVNEDPKDLDARGAMCVASAMALMADGINWSHAFAHTFSNLFHTVPHGLACAWAFPNYVKWMIPHRMEETKILANIVGVDYNSLTVAEDIYQKLIAFVKSMGIPAPKDCEGIDKEQWFNAADLVMAETPYLFTVDKPNKEECTELLKEMYYSLD